MPNGKHCIISILSKFLPPVCLVRYYLIIESLSDQFLTQSPQSLGAVFVESIRFGMIVCNLTIIEVRSVIVCLHTRERFFH